MNTQERLTAMSEADVCDISEIIKNFTDNKIKFIPIPCKNDSEFKLMVKVMKTRMRDIIKQHT